MATRIVKVPDIGEGIAEAELVAWHVQVGDLVQEEQPIAEVMTDKATVEIPAPFGGRVAALGGEVGNLLAVGSELIRLEVDGAAAESAPPRKVPVAPKPEPAPPPPPPPAAAQVALAAPPPAGGKPLASPAVRQKAREAGVDLRQLRGTGPAGRIQHEDLDAFLRGGGAARPGGRQARADVEEIRVTGLRRRIAERMAEATRRVAHFSYVEEVDVTALEELRAGLNAGAAQGERLTILPFLMHAVVRAVAAFPQMNAHYDDEAQVIRRFGAVHLGVATQTPGGLMVPVVRHAEARSLRDCAAEARRLAEAARQGVASREELTGSTITLSSLGALGGIAATPVINLPEVAIIGVNRIAIRPAWRDGGFVPRRMMNLSSSFDHRVVDGQDAASFIQRIRTLLEAPALLFMEE